MEVGPFKYRSYHSKCIFPELVIHRMLESLTTLLFEQESFFRLPPPVIAATYIQNLESRQEGMAAEQQICLSGLKKNQTGGRVHARMQHIDCTTVSGVRMPRAKAGCGFRNNTQIP